MVNFNPAAPKAHVGTTTGQVQNSIGTGEINIPNLPTMFPKTVHVMPYFKHTLLSVGKKCDADCRVEFTKDAVVVYNPQQSHILYGWCKTTGAKLWCISLNPDPTTLPNIPTTTEQSTLQAFIAYDLPSVEALVNTSTLPPASQLRIRGSRQSKGSIMHPGQGSPMRMLKNTALRQMILSRDI